MWNTHFVIYSSYTYIFHSCDNSENPAQKTNAKCFYFTSGPTRATSGSLVNKERQKGKRTMGYSFFPFLLYQNCQHKQLAKEGKNMSKNRCGTMSRLFVCLSVLLPSSCLKVLG